MSQLWGMSKTPTTAVKFWVVGKIRVFCFLPSLIEASRADWCGAPLEMAEGTTSGARVQSAFKVGSAEWAPQQRPLPLPNTLHVAGSVKNQQILSWSGNSLLYKTRHSLTCS
jgi:hypothetical protein